jgi:Domain of unknown function (DUF6457)
MLDEWVTKLSQEIGVKPDDIAISEILDLARDAAHAVARPAAPITTFIVGYAAGMRGGGRDTIAQTVREALAAIAAELPPADASVISSNGNGNGASHGYGAISGSTAAPGSAPTSPVPGSIAPAPTPASVSLPVSNGESGGSAAGS